MEPANKKETNVLIIKREPENVNNVNMDTELLKDGAIPE